MKKVSKSPLVMDVLNIPNVQRQLERLADLLGKIQKALGEYLERERASFPRYVYIFKVNDKGAVSLTYLSILKEGFTPIFSATLSNGKAFHHKKTGVTFPICLGKRSVHNFSHSVNMSATLNIALWKC